MPIISPKIPSGLEELMRGLAKSVIKENPQNIYEFAAEYFENLLKERDGSVDQSYKKFATYKVYRKNKSARKRGKENANDVNDTQSDNGLKRDANAVNYVDQHGFAKRDSVEDKSVEEIILPEAAHGLQSIPKAKTSISSESEISASIKQEPSVEVEAVPSRGNSEEDDDVKNMVLDDDMEQAALKIQSTFRGHKVRRDMKDTEVENEEQVEGGREAVVELQQIDSEEKLENDDAAVSDGCVNENENEHEIASNDTRGPIESEVDDDIANMVLDDDMEQAALKIQSTFRGHKVRRDIKETLIPENDENNEEVKVDEVEGVDGAIKETIAEAGDEALASLSTERSEQEVEIALEEVPQIESENVIAVEAQEGSIVDDALGSEAQQEKKENADNGVDIVDEPEALEKALDEAASDAVVEETVSAETAIDDGNVVVDDEGIDENVAIDKENIEGNSGVDGENIEETSHVDEEKIDIESEVVEEYLVDENIDETAAVEKENIVETPTEIADHLVEENYLEITELVTEKVEETSSENLATEIVQENFVKNLPIENVEESSPENVETVNETIQDQTVDGSFAGSPTADESETVEAADNETLVKPPSVEIPDGEVNEKEEIPIDAEIAAQKLSSIEMEGTEKLESVEIEASEEEVASEAPLETHPSMENEIEQTQLEGDDSMPEGVEALNDEPLVNEFSAPEAIHDEASNFETEQSDVEVGENQIESEDVIELADNVPLGDTEAEEETLIESGDKPLELKEGENNAEVNEQEPQEGLNDLPNESENEKAADGSPVVEEVCEKKLFENLEEMNESEIDDVICGEIAINEAAVDEETIDIENVEKLPSGEVEYASLRESISERDVTPAESVDEVDNKSADLTDEKSIDGDTTGSKDEKSNEDEKHNADDVEMNEQLEVDPNAVEPILHEEISPIELMDEVLNENAGTLANELFSENVEQTNEAIEQEVDLIESGNENRRESESVEPKLNQSEPLLEIELPKSIDLSEQMVELSQDEMEPIRDEILQVEDDDSEIPEESQVPTDENIPTVSMEEKSPSLEQGDESEVEEKSEPQQPQVEDDVADMILDDEMEDAALKIQAAFRGHQVRRERIAQPEDDAEKNEQSQDVDSPVVIDQCSEETQETQEHEETEQQDTSADVEEMQESETVDQENTQEETHEAENTEEEDTAVESAENETADAAEDDPDGTPEEEKAVEQPQNNNDDDDVANMVLDEEMEQAALKIQSTFRGHKTRKDIKKDDAEGEASTCDEQPEPKDSVQDVDDDIANMVLDDEMEQAALKIQSTFRGHKTRKDCKKDENADETVEETVDEEKPEDKKEEVEEAAKEEETPQSSTEKTAKQLQEEEDIAGLVMDAEMEQTALKIQSAFRGKNLRRKPKDGEDSFGSSAGDDVTPDEESPAKSEEEDPFEQREVQEQSYDEERGSDYSAAHYSDENRYSVDRFDGSYEYEPLPKNTSTDDLNLMQGGGIFPEPSGESSDMLAGSSGEDRDPERNSSLEKFPSEKSVEAEEQITQQEAVDPLSDEKVIENFDFEANKNTAEAMYYSLKKNEMETQKQLSIETQFSLEEERNALSTETSFNLENQSVERDNEDEDEDEDEDDDDVVVGIQAPLSSAKRLKYGMSMDDRLLGSILSQDYLKPRRDGYPDDSFDPMLEASMRNHHFLEKLHEMSTSDEDKNIPYGDFPDGVGDEDQFEDFYSSHDIRKKIMASSISIADSDYFDPTNNKSIIDDDTIRTALETIHSTDSESTIASAATKIQAGERMITKRNNHSMYSSIGNAAIDRSLDEFIQSQELRIERFDEEFEGYSSPPPRKQESVDEWTDNDTATYTDSDKKVASGGVIEIKLEQKTSFLTVDERRRTLHREDAIQRNSTREDEDTSKSSNASGEKLLDKSSPTADIVTAVAHQDSVIDTEIPVPVLDLTGKSKSSSLAQAKPQRMKRQHTMPVQIQTDVIRVIPKHLRKRIKSADSSDKKKRLPK